MYSSLMVILEDQRLHLRLRSEDDDADCGSSKQKSQEVTQVLVVQFP